MEAHKFVTPSAKKVSFSFKLLLIMCYLAIWVQRCQSYSHSIISHSILLFQCQFQYKKFYLVGTKYSVLNAIIFKMRCTGTSQRHRAGLVGNKFSNSKSPIKVLHQSGFWYPETNHVNDSTNSRFQTRYSML